MMGYNVCVDYYHIKAIASNEQGTLHLKYCIVAVSQRYCRFQIGNTNCSIASNAEETKLIKSSVHTIIDKGNRREQCAKTSYTCLPFTLYK